MGASRGTDSFRNVPDSYDGYTVVDADGGKIGTVDTTYVIEATQKEYVAVRRGLAGLIPARALASYPWTSARWTTPAGPSRLPPTKTQSRTRLR
jgi:hypothetical protein